MKKREGARAARAIATAMSRVCNKEGEGGNATAMAMATSMAGEWSAIGTKRAMAIATRVVGEVRQQQQRGQW